MLVGDLHVRVHILYAAICCALIWTCRATWYSTQYIACLSSTRIGIATGEIESLRSWKACMQMRWTHLFSSSKPLLSFFLLSIQPSSFLFFCPPLYLFNSVLHQSRFGTGASVQTGKNTAADSLSSIKLAVLLLFSHWEFVKKKRSSKSKSICGVRGWFPSVM